MKVIAHTPQLTEDERKRKISYITEEMLKIAKRVNAKKNDLNKKTQGD